MLSTRSIILIILLLGSTFKGVAQESNIFASFGINDGLPQSSIWSIIQDSDGFMWFGTSDGTCRFDGYSFKVYKKPLSVQDMLIDSGGELWAISVEGIYRYNSIKDSFLNICRFERGPSQEMITSFYGEDNKYIWASLPQFGTVKIDKHTNVVSKVECKGGNADFSDWGNMGWQIGFTDKDKIWICTTPGSLYVYDKRNEHFNKLTTPLINNMINLNDSLILGTTFEGLVLFNKNNYSYKEIPLEIFNKNELLGRDLLILPGSQLLIATLVGVIHVDTRTWKITKHLTSFEVDKKQSYSFVQCLYKDQSGNMWYGTNGDGIKKLRAPYKKFMLYSSFSERSNLVKALYADKKNLYAGYYKNNVDVFDRKNGFVKNLFSQNETDAEMHVHALGGLDSNTVIIKKNDKDALYAYSDKTGKITSLLPLIKKVLPGTTDTVFGYRFIYKDKDTLYIGIGSEVIQLYSIAGNIGGVRLVSEPANIIFTCAFIDREGTKFIGAGSGLFYLNDGKLVKIPLPETVHVKNVNQDVNGYYWVCTLRGIYILDKNKKVVKHYDESNGLSNSFVYGTLRDKNNDMWFSHNKGLTRYNMKTGKFRHYMVEDGLQSNEFNTGALFQADDGTLFFGGINGTNAFDPDEIRDNPNVPRVVITNIKLFDKDLKTDTSYWHLHKIQLPYTQNSLTFEFSGLEFTNSAQNQYAYIMEGLDEQWIFSGKTRFARYPALPPGTYYFKVKASNNDGIWQETPTVIQVVIVPPFWQTWWFRTLCVLLLVMIVVGIVNWFQKQRHKAQLRTIELQQKIQQERERISRDLHDNVGTQLSLISNNIEWIEHPLKELSEKEKTEKLHYVNHISREIIATLRETIWALKKEQISLEEFSDKLKAFVQKQLTVYPEIELEFNEEIDEPLTLGPSEALNLFRICQEAVANALKYSGAKDITINIENREGKYNISIQDKGKGFDLNKVDASVQNGLENMRYRSADIDCILTIDTEAGKGTTVIIIKK